MDKKDSSPEENRKLYRLYKINTLFFWRRSNFLRHGVHFDYMDPNILEKNMEAKKTSV